MSRVFVVDDDAESCRLLAEILEEEGHSVQWTTEPHRMLEAADAGCDLAILDLRMPGMNGVELMRRLRKNRPTMPVIIMTGFGSVDTAVEAVAAGAVDYVSKPMNVDEIRACVRRALGRQLEIEVSLPSDNEEAGEIIGRTPSMVDVYKTIARVATQPSTVLILGESGTGKDLVAHAIHRHSTRRNKPFVAVDCTSLPETLLESELFGYVRGAFTGAVSDSPGLFAEANGGTIFLDEIGDLAPTLQAKLLRVLQERQIRPVGGTQWREVDVRVLAATNRDLNQAVNEGRFREDLYYRLKVVTIHLPPLRERTDDIPLLIDHLVRQAARRCSKPVRGLSKGALAVLRAYHWPGNVRELGHVLERTVALSQHEVIGLDDLPEEIRKSDARPVDPAPATDTLIGGRPSLEELKQRYIQRVLEESAGNVTRAAAILGIDRRSLYRMVERYGIPLRDDEA